MMQPDTYGRTREPATFPIMGANTFSIMNGAVEVALWVH